METSNNNNNKNTPQKSTEKNTENKLILPPLPTRVHEIIIRDQVLTVEPPLEKTRMDWIKQFHAWLGKKKKKNFFSPEFFFFFLQVLFA